MTFYPANAGTMTTRGAMAALRAEIDSLFKSRPRETAMAGVVRALGAEAAAPQPPQPDVLGEVRRRVVEAARTPNGLAALPRRDLRDAAWLLWTRSDPLAAHPLIFQAVVDQAALHRSTCRNLINGWIGGFDRSAPRIDEAGYAIVRLVEGSDDHRFDRWRCAHCDFSFFDPATGPAKIAQRIVSGPEPLADVLIVTGLDDPFRAVSGYARAVLDETLRLVPDALRLRDAGATRQRAFDFIAPDEKLRFQEARGAVADACVAPWLVDASAPEDARAEVQIFLLRHLGDPRIRPQQWLQASKSTTARMRSWLAKRSIELFFDIIADHSDERFQYRRAFWRACLEHIEDARIALGTRVGQHAAGIAELRGSYAQLKGTAANQSVVLMKIGDLVLCEWSHSGKLRAWQSDWKNAPSLDRDEYERAILTTKGLPFPPHAAFGANGAPDGSGLSHIGSDRDYWQSSAAELLRRRTAVRLQPKDWRPR